MLHLLQDPDKVYFENETRNEKTNTIRKKYHSIVPLWRATFGFNPLAQKIETAKSLKGGITKDN